MNQPRHPSFSSLLNVVQRVLTFVAALSFLTLSDVCLAQSTAELSFSNLQAHGDFVYWLDRKENGIYRARTPRVSGLRLQTPAPLVNPEKLWSGLPLTSPVAITVDSSGVVYVLDDQVKGVFSLTSSAPKLLHSFSTLVRPTAIAAVRDRLFLIDSGAAKLYSVGAAGGELNLEYEFKEETPDRLLADGGNLITYHFQTSVLLHFWFAQGDPTIGESAGEAPKPVRLTSGRKFTLTKLVGHATDLSVRNDIVYFIDPEADKLALLPLEGVGSSLMPLSLVANKPLGLVASSDSLFFVESDPMRIRRQPSLQPVTLNFVGEFTSKSMVDFYEYLFAKELLPKKTVVVAGATTLKDLVDELKLLPTGYVDDLQLLICKLNEAICSPAQKILPAAGAPAPESFAVKLNSGQSITFPDLKVTAYITRRNLKLPLDPKTYNPKLFGHLSNSSLEQVAKELGPKTFSNETLRETLIKYNTDYFGSDIFNETKGSFSVPVQGARITAVVPRSDLLDPTSLVRRLSEKKNISGTSPMFQMKSQSVRSQAVAALLAPESLRPMTSDCLPTDPAIRSAAMDLINYCEPVLAEPPEVGIIDYGFNPQHPAFALPNGGSALEVFSQADQPFETSPLALDRARTNYHPDDHGTHIAAIIGARSQPGEMVGLLPTARLFGAPLASLNKALEQWHFLRIFNVSLGEAGATGGPLSGTDDLDTAITAHRLKLFVLSAGNENRVLQKNALAAHGTTDNVIVVGATNVPPVNPDNKRPDRILWTTSNGKGSNRHPYFVNLMAPGEKIKSALFNGRYGFADGTSAAAAFVSGGAAALMTLEPHWAPWQIKFRLIATADLWTGTFKSDAVLAGELNFKRAMTDRDAVVIQRQGSTESCLGDIVYSPTQKIVIKQGDREHKILSWGHILRIKRDHPTGTEYTILYYLINTFQDRDNRELIKVTKVTVGQIPENDSFIFVPRDPSRCEGRSLSVSDLVDFVNKGPFVLPSN